MANKKGQTTIYKTLDTKDRATQTPLQTGMDSCAPEGLTVPAPLVAPIVLVRRQTLYLDLPFTR